MGIYLNSGNSGFSEILKSDYVDKTGLIRMINSTIGTKKKLTCISRPRRFGKSYAAQMLCAYYDKSCDSHPLFASCAIAHDTTYETHINKYHVVNLDVTSFISEAKKEGMQLGEVPGMITCSVRRDVEEQYPELKTYGTLNDMLIALVRSTGTKIIFILDEWDAMIRETLDDENAQERYLNLLRGWFKNRVYR